MVTRLYVIPDILLKVALNTNTIDDQVLHYTSHIFERGVNELLNGALSTNKTGDQFIHYT